MSGWQERAFEVVILANAFRTSGRAAIAADFPASVLALRDAVIALPEWASASLTEQALMVARVLDESPDLESAYQASVDAGELGFGAGEDAEIDAAIDEVGRHLNTDIFLSDDAAPLEAAAPPADDPPTDDLAPMPPGASAEGAPAMPPPPMGRVAPTAPPPVPVPAPIDTVSSWLNAALDAPDSGPAVGTASTLTVFFGERSDDAVASVRSHVAFRRDQSELAVTVDVASSDFDVDAPSRTVTLRRDGTSDRAAFAITPRRTGIGTVTVIVSVAGNFLQRLDVTFDVGGAAPTDAVTAPPAVTTLGRPVAAADVLGPRVASIQIHRAGDAFEVLALEASRAPLTIQATALDFAPRIAAVREALLRAVKKDPVSLALDIPQEHTDALLADLAFAGYRLYQSVFEDGASSDLRAVGDWLRGLVAQDSVTTLQIVSDGFPVPWPLMYLVDEFDPAHLSWDRFLGMQCVVEQIPLVRIEAAPPGTTIDSQPELAVRTIFNETIDAEMPSHPIAGQRAYWSASGAHVTEGTTRADLQAALAAEATDQVLYLLCHAETDDDDADASELILTGKDVITLGELKALAPERRALAGHPLIFLNACESGELSPLFYAGFVPYFLNKGARGVIGTECRTPGLFAAEWATAFFDALLAGRPLGEVVLDLRRRFLAEHNNPLGLLYVVHCDTDTVISPALA